MIRRKLALSGTKEASSRSAVGLSSLVCGSHSTSVGKAPLGQRRVGPGRIPTVQDGLDVLHHDDVLVHVCLLESVQSAVDVAR